MPGFPSATHTSSDLIEHHALVPSLACPETATHQGTVPLVPHTDIQVAAATSDATRETAKDTTECRGAEEAEEPQRDTPLRRRFLKEVGGVAGVVMVSELDMDGGGCGGRGTPVSRRGTPTKGREARVGGRVTPVGGRASPSKEVLEVGVGGFYFSCEIPVWKVVPKMGTPTKVGTPVKLSDRGCGGSPVQRRLFRAEKKKKEVENTPTLERKMTPGRNDTKSSAKNTPDQSSKGSPKKPQSGTPLRAMDTPKSSKRRPNEGQSPTKARKTPSRGAIHSRGGKLSLEQSPRSLVDLENKENTTITTQSLAINSPIGDPPNATKQSNTSGPYDIGGLMARLKSAPTPRASTSKPSEAETGSSAPPTPLRKAAESIQVTPVSAVVKRDKGAEVMQNEVVSLEVGSSGKESGDAETGYLVSTSAGLSRHSRSFKNLSASPATGNLVTTRSPTLGREFGSEDIAPKSTGKHVHFPSASQLAETVGNPRKLSMTESNGTEGWVMGAMQREMDEIQGSMKKAGSSREKNVPTTESGAEERSQHTEDQHAMYTPTPAQRLWKMGAAKTKASGQGFVKTTNLVTMSPNVVRTTNPSAAIPSARNSPSDSPTISNDPNAPRSINAPKPKVPAYARPTQASRASTAQPKGITHTKNSLARKGAPGKASGHSRTTSKPQIERVISAIEISERVKKWHAEEGIGGTTSPANSDTSNTTRFPQSQKHDTQASHTPPGSPPTAGSKDHHTRPYPSTQKGDMKTAIVLPPKTGRPQPRFPKAHNAHTPMKSKIPEYDRNAFRTPSKEIEGSLSAAIDQKIREDRVGG